MTLTPEQKETVATWIAAGDNLSAVQKKLREQFSVTMTYMDVRFLVDDLNLNLKDPPSKAESTDVSKVPPPSNAEKTRSRPAANPAGGDDDQTVMDEPSAGADAMEDAEGDTMDEADAPPSDGASGVIVDVDKVTLNPGALASGSVTFSDGVTAKWIVDNYGRPGFTEVSKPGYRPKPEEAQAFMQELSVQLQKRGF
ncbi:MAG: hypothetical protein HS122_16165 [Opitutaceae bacterium]|nr:hypothetical protein [Opitutaceae bacterium]